MYTEIVYSMIINTERPTTIDKSAAYSELFVVSMHP